MNKLPAKTGWLWFKQGAGLFRKQPGALTMLLFANILIAIAVGLVPWVGSWLSVVLIPSFSMAFMQACLAIDSGQRVTPDVLMTGFRKPALARLCKIGLIYLVISVAVPLLMSVMLDPSLMQQFGKPINPDKPPVLHASDALAMGFIFLLEMAALAALCFAAPLTCWKQMGAGKAVFYSFFAVLKSARVFAVLLLSWFGIFVAVLMLVLLIFTGARIGQVVTIWLGFLFILLLQCAMYAGYREIFGKPDETQNPAA